MILALLRVNDGGKVGIRYNTILFKLLDVTVLGINLRNLGGTTGYDCDTSCLQVQSLFSHRVYIK